MIDYTGLTDKQAHAKRRADRGNKWKDCDWYGDGDGGRLDGLAHDLRQALHDRDRYHRDAEYWREECIKLTWEALS